MNPIVRDYLIELTRSPKEFVLYSDLVIHCALDIDLNIFKGQEELKQPLVAVSTFEHHLCERPLLSSLAINKEEHTHGSGFYALAQELGFTAAANTVPGIPEIASLPLSVPLTKTQTSIKL